MINLDLCGVRRRFTDEHVGPPQNGDSSERESVALRKSQAAAWRTEITGFIPSGKVPTRSARVPGEPATMIRQPSTVN